LGPYSLFYSPLLASIESRNKFDCLFFIYNIDKASSE
jgi:hypothetical protein